MTFGDYGIVANVREPDRIFRKGARVWISGGTGGEGWTRFKWYGLSRGGRRLEKWAPTYRFDTFRAKWIPAHMHARFVYGVYFQGTREEMTKQAQALEEFAQAERRQHPNRWPAHAAIRSSAST